MKKKLLLIFLGIFAVFLAVFLARAQGFSFDEVQRMFASVFFVESISARELHEKYGRAATGGAKVRILIVPGHDNDAWGTEFRGVREADMNAVLGEELARLLRGNPRVEAILLRDTRDYAPFFKEYLAREERTVRAFIRTKKRLMHDLERAGRVHAVEGVPHNSAPFETAFKLYGVNQWANENGIDVVLHLHFNDYAGRPHYRPGRYEGFVFYVPEAQYSNARGSRAIADSLFAQLSQFYAASNLPKEDAGIVPDQELIAIGAYNTLDAASVLIEYGYIYETQFRDARIREAFLRELALQTKLGLGRFFADSAAANERYPTTFLPHEWREPLSEGDYHHPSVLSLQAALLFERLYPPEGDKRACPLTGSFGPCTRRAVIAFQRKYGILPASGSVGEDTLAKLNELYSR